MHSHLLPLIGEVDFTSSISLGSLLVSGVGALVYILVRYRIDKKAMAEKVWQSEHAAQKERADRLQREKDELGGQVRDLQVRCAELENRPDLATVRDILDTLTHATTQMQQSLLEQIQSLLEQIREHDKRSMERFALLAADSQRLVAALEVRARRFRQDDEAGDPPGLE